MIALGQCKIRMLSSFFFVLKTQNILTFFQNFLSLSGRFQTNKKYSKIRDSWIVPYVKLAPVPWFLTPQIVAASCKSENMLCTLFILKSFSAESNLINNSQALVQQGSAGQKNFSVQPRFNATCDALDSAAECQAHFQKTFFECIESCADEICASICQRSYLINIASNKVTMIQFLMISASWELCHLF